MNFHLRIKSVISFILYYTGILDVIKRIKLRNKAFVLMFHRVINSNNCDTNYIQPGMYVTQDTFEMHVKFLKENFNIILLDKLIKKLENNEDISNCCAITFDDGWADNYENAFPILKKYRVPATIFLATGYIGTNNCFWPEDVSFYLLKLISNENKVDNMPKDIQEILSNKKLPKTDKIDSAIEKLKSLPPQERDTFIEQLHSIFPVINKKKLLMDWDQIREMYESGLVSFGAHTVNHKILTQIGHESIQHEVCLSQKHIEEVLKKKIILFAYPNGNLNEQIIKTLIKCKFNGAVVTRKGYLNHQTPLMEIPRIGVHNDISNTKHLFFARILLEKF